jgi:transcription elongation factor Elf1
VLNSPSLTVKYIKYINYNGGVIMLESTDLSILEVQDNVDVYSLWIDETNVDEYANAFKDNIK